MTCKKNIGALKNMENYEIKIKQEISGISYCNEKGKRIFISETMIRLLGDVKEVDEYFIKTIDALINIKYDNYEIKYQG
jgi:hypothetical protein